VVPGPPAGTFTLLSLFHELHVVLGERDLGFSVRGARDRILSMGRDGRGC
jgi:hypothetical protein